MTGSIREDTLAKGRAFQNECDQTLGLSAYCSARMARDGFAVRHFLELLKAAEREAATAVERDAALEEV